jgi:outer membrane protein assembly factor BamB
MTAPALDELGNVYFGTSNNRLNALDADGELLWTAPLDSNPTSGICLDFAGVLYVGCRDGQVHAIQAAVGLADSPWPMFRQNPRHTGRSGD